MARAGAGVQLARISAIFSPTYFFTLSAIPFTNTIVVLMSWRMSLPVS